MSALSMDNSALIEAIGAIGPPTCGRRMGGHMGVLAAGERASAPATATFRADWPRESELYLASLP